MSRKLRGCVYLLLAGGVAWAASLVSAQRLNPPKPSELPVVSGDYPRVFFFRQSEGWARSGQLEYEAWDAAFSRLMGIEGKVLDEEVPGTSRRNIDFFTRFKRNHPGQLVLLHYNGNARDPRFEREAFFAGHWLYHVGSEILSDVPAEEGITEIKVADPSLYRTGTGRYRDKNEDIGLCALDAQGRPDWSRSEQVQLVSVDVENQTIRVRRACYGTQPRAFAGGAAYAAAHASEGPWGRRSNLMWFYNYATCCPEDAQGRTAWQVHAEDVARRFAEGGELAVFDGLEFDVLAFRHADRRRPFDCNADGEADNGVIDGVNVYGLGVNRFLKELRHRMGEGKLILADGQQDAGGQRGFGILNGIESEGFPHIRDAEIANWSGGINRHNYWAAFSREPVFNYINHKFIEPTGQPGVVGRPDVPFSRHRLAFAAAMFTDAALCYSFTPPRGDQAVIGVWDEYWAGQEKRLGWLGKPLGPPKTLALDMPDRLTDLLDAIRQGGRQAEMAAQAGLRWEGDHFVWRAGGEDAQNLTAEVSTSISGEDLYLSLTAWAEPMAGYPENVARFATVKIVPHNWFMRERSLTDCQMQLRGEAPQPLNEETGATVRMAGEVSLDGKSLHAFRAHPPYRGKTGRVWWRIALHPSPGEQLHFATGMGERAPGRSDGVVFRVEAWQLSEQADPESEPVVLFEQNQIASQWNEHQVPLDELAGKTWEIRFIADAGPDDNPTTDHAFWGDVWAGSEPPVRLSQAEAEHGTWLGPEPFTSGFYFRNLKPGNYGLVIEVEGSQPIHIERLSVHEAPDARYRAFEHGLVLANPSGHDVTFDLSQIAPGRRFQRIRGTTAQDPAANNGQPVGERVVLPPVDALFLLER